MKTQTYTNKLFIQLSLVLLMVLSFSGLGYAQGISGPTPVTVGDTETYTYDDGYSKPTHNWIVTGGSVQSTSNSGTAYSAVILWNTVGTGTITFTGKYGTVLASKQVVVEAVPAPIIVTDLNYIHNIRPTVKTTNINGLNNADKIESITYFDGLGRARQSIGIRAGGNSEDIITHIAYDEFGRQVKEYLPYSSSTAIGTYRTDALDATLTYYDASVYEADFPEMSAADINPYSEKAFDNSPLNRVEQQAAPGKDWKLGNGHEVEMNYLTNGTNEVRYYYVTLTKAVSNGVVTYNPTLQLSGYYGVHQLHKTVTKDENHNGSSSKDHSVEEFTNKQGQLILKRTYDQEKAHDTYYVYDDYGNLSYVLPPKSEPQDEKPDATELSELCYQYKYDDRNRLVEKKIPGKGWEEIVYNKLDQPIMTRDENLKEKGEWLVTKYDAFGRVAYTAIKKVGWTRVGFQGMFNNDPATVPQFESKVTSGTGYLNTYYTSVARPTGVDEILTINYYDNYSFDLDGGNSETAYGVTPTTNVKGLVTGSKIRVLGTNDWITTVTYFDEKARAIYVYSRNRYLDKTDKIKSDFSFDNRVLETTTTHFNNVFPSSTTTIIDVYTYDDANRLLEHQQKINDAALFEVIASNEYDDLGQLVRKRVGGKTNQTRLQEIDYTYNIRGWLKTINDPNNLGEDLFGFKINYNTEDHNATRLYNGNIAETAWKTKSDNVLRAYKYNYDALNRIISGHIINTSNSSQNNKHNLKLVEYDKNGNITSLRRSGYHSNGSYVEYMDHLTYTYAPKSNQLVDVKEDGHHYAGFADESNTQSLDYSYDPNGNMISDANKGVSSIIYNHLNLPTNVSLPSGDIGYVYDATGVKQKKIVGEGSITEYAGGFIYENGEMKMLSHPQGYVDVAGGKKPRFDYVYQYKDHLGNIRLTYSDSDGNGIVNGDTEIIEEDNYYPFGLKHKGYNNNVSANANSVASKYKYNGKELNDELGLDWYDYGARNYEASIGRWMNLDPLADKYFDKSAYTYSLNNPTFYVDPDGREVKNGATVKLEEEKKLRKNMNNIVTTYEKKFGKTKEEFKKNAGKNWRSRWKAYNGRKSNLRKKDQEISILEFQEKKTNELIKELKNTESEKFNELNTVTNELGDEVDVYLHVVSNPQGSNDGTTSRNMTEITNSSGDRHFIPSHPLFGANAIEVQVPRHTTSENDTGDKIVKRTTMHIIYHESGHVIYQANFTTEYNKWLRDNNKGPDYDGHGTGDPSEAAAKKAEKND